MNARRLALVGCGGIVRACHGPVLHDLMRIGSIEWVGCCDTKSESASHVASQFGFEDFAGGLQRLLCEGRPDAALIAVPPVAVAHVAAEVIRHGVPVLIEKPPAITTEELDSLILLAGQRRVPTQVAFNRRYAPAVREMRNRLADAPSLVSVHGVMTRTNRRDADFTTTAIHLIDTVRFVLDDDYESLSLRYRTTESSTCYYVDGWMRSGVGVQLEICPTAGVVTETLTVRCHGRTLELRSPVTGFEHECAGEVRDWSDGQLRGVPWKANNVAGHRVNGMYAQMVDFLNRLDCGQPIQIDLAAARQSLEVAIALQQRCPSFKRNCL